MSRVFLLVAVVLLNLVAGKGALDGKKREFPQNPEFPVCATDELQQPLSATAERLHLSVNEGTKHHSCIVTNRGKTPALVRVMCGGGDKPDSDVDRATYVYAAPGRTLVLNGMCPPGHRCRLCGATKYTPSLGTDLDGQKVLERQDYECRRRCVAVLYQHEDFNGHMQTFSHNANDLRDTLMEGKISAVKVIGKDCELRLYDKPNLDGKRCSIETGAFHEVTKDMDEIQRECGCHDCIRSMSIREKDRCGPEERCDPPPPPGKECEGKEYDCIPCKDNDPAKGPVKCCVTRKAHGSGVTAREVALKRLFEAMAAVLEDK